mgnify:CR=1 FL=1
MKKQYISPLTVTDIQEEQEMLCSSYVSSNIGIGYGGVDDEGAMDPNARWGAGKSLWDDEED